MTIEEFQRKILEAGEEDWQKITCWGAGSGPSYLSQLVESSEGQVVEAHSVVAVLKSDISIRIAWGIGSNPDFKEEWANQFPDPHASSGFVDFFYNGALVFRDLYVNVDGARCRLPCPKQKFDDSSNLVGLTVARDRYGFFRVLDGMERVSEFERYAKRAGFQVVDEPWMAA